MSTPFSPHRFRPIFAIAHVHRELKALLIISEVRLATFGHRSWQCEGQYEDNSVG
jgi:hypothetical protein